MPGRYLFNGEFRDRGTGFTIHITDPSEVEVLPPEFPAYQVFMAVGDSEPPALSPKQFIRIANGTLVGRAEYWDGEWTGPLEPSENSRVSLNVIRLVIHFPQ